MAGGGAARAAAGGATPPWVAPTAVWQPGDRLVVSWEVPEVPASSM
jgi:hypothetical protein